MRYLCWSAQYASTPDLADALLAYGLFWLKLIAARADEEGEEHYAPPAALQDGAFALLRHARGLELSTARTISPCHAPAPRAGAGDYLVGLIKARFPSLSWMGAPVSSTK